MADIWYDVDTNLQEVPVNVLPLLDDTDFKTIETAVLYNAAGLDLVWNFVTTNGTFIQRHIQPTGEATTGTGTAGTYDWTNQTHGMYTVSIPASGGTTVNNDTEGFGWFTGVATGVLPWRGPVCGFRAAIVNDSLIDGGDYLQVDVLQANGTNVSALADLYHADINFARDQTNTKDEWTVTWFKNGVRVTAGITSPTIQAIKRVDGTDLIASQAMTQIGSTGSYKYDATATSGAGSTNERITVGEAVVAIAAATIDSGSRSFPRVISRDSS